MPDARERPKPGQAWEFHSKPVAGKSIPSHPPTIVLVCVLTPGGGKVVHVIANGDISQSEYRDQDIDWAASRHLI